MTRLLFTTTTIQLTVLLTFVSCDGGETCDKGVYEGDMRVRSAKDLAACVGYTSVTGDLDLRDCEGCTDLRELRCLESVGGSIYIGSNDDLESLDGLRGVTSVGEWIDIQDNHSLRDLDGLSG